ncbi:hypothetical protein D3C75_1124780 [compost metagenome]
MADSNPASRATRPAAKSRMPGASIMVIHWRQDMLRRAGAGGSSLGMVLQANRKPAATIGIFTKKIPCQSHQWIKTPPIKGPIAAAPDRKMDITDSADACFSVI